MLDKMLKSWEFLAMTFGTAQTTILWQAMFLRQQPPSYPCVGDAIVLGTPPWANQRGDGEKTKEHALSRLSLVLRLTT